ncbi:FAD-binding oxidoreductase [Sabulicella glaciei]|uniref:FAD-binding oxidoreductase n=1 Tax=Sabulicella glaciei TaxID=2984948 RepID=A0ABT3NXW7_9PROT|nr:FAD-binding oxidoreductase [Roseococcus sp. MDT2-1-1]MCW8086971.1 FAD-binding oxidoreductase [Roseococcus sp. MDT2-1-1]
MPPLDLLADTLGPQGLLRDAGDVAPYAVDWRGVYRGHPEAVLRPASTAEVASALRLCADLGLAVVPAGGRTSLCGAAVPIEQGPPSVVLSLERMNRIRALDPLDLSLVAEAGCTVEAVQVAAEAAGRFFPLHFGAQGSAMVGGALSTNAGGIRTLRYGNARDLVLGLEVVLPDGRVLDDLRRVRKDNSGYALRHLFMGAEGTLGVITAASLKLFPPLLKRETALVAVRSPHEALRLLARCQGSGAELVAFELIGRPCIEITLKHAPHVRKPMELSTSWFCLVEAASTHLSIPVREALEAALMAALEAGEAEDVILCESEDQRRNLWDIREGFPACSRQEAPGLPTDTAVPVSAIPDFLESCGALIAERYPEGKMVAIGHMGDGNIHLSLQAPPGTTHADWARRGAGFEERVGEIAVELGGSFSAEHGIGQSKRAAMAGLKDPVTLSVMRAIKDVLDPAGRMNPGKVLPPP